MPRQEVTCWLKDHPKINVVFEQDLFMPEDQHVLKKNVIKTIFGFSRQMRILSKIEVSILDFCRVRRSFTEIWCEIGFQGLGFLDTDFMV